MTIDEAIKHCEEVMMENLEKTKDRNASDPIAISCGECADNHRKLAEWLKELKRQREAWNKLKDDVVAYRNNFDYCTAMNFLDIIDTRLSEIRRDGE